MTDRSISLEKQADGSYVADRDGERIAVPVLQRFGVDAVDRLRAEYEVAEEFSYRDENPNHADVYAKRVAWKIAGYTEMKERAERAGRKVSQELIDRLAYWSSQSAAIRGGGR